MFREKFGLNKISLMYNKTMKERSKTKEKTFRPVRKDTKVSTIEKKYGINLGVRSDMTIGTYFKKMGFPSLSSMLRSSK